MSDSENATIVNSIIKSYIEIENNMHILKIYNNPQYKEMKKWIKYKMKWGF